MKRYILVIDGVGKTKLELSIMLKNYNIEIIHAKDVLGAVSRIVELKDSIKLIICDLDDDNIELQSIINVKAKEMCKNIPLVIASHHKEKKYIIKMIQAGAIEYIMKPFTEELIVKKINELIGIKHNDKTEPLEEDFDESNEMLFSLKDILSVHFKSMTRGNYPLSIIMFRLINTQEAKENKRKQALSTIVKITKTKLRETDIIIKYYSDNVLILLPFTDNYGANLVEKKIREHFIENSVVNQKADGFILASSIVTLPEEGRDKNYILMKLKSKLKPTMFFSKKQYKL